MKAIVPAGLEAKLFSVLLSSQEPVLLFLEKENEKEKKTKPRNNPINPFLHKTAAIIIKTQ